MNFRQALLQNPWIPWSTTRLSTHITAANKTGVDLRNIARIHYKLRKEGILRINSRYLHFEGFV